MIFYYAKFVTIDQNYVKNIYMVVAYFFQSGLKMSLDWATARKYKNHNQYLIF